MKKFISGVIEPNCSSGSGQVRTDGREVGELAEAMKREFKAKGKREKWSNQMSVKRIVPDIKSKHLDASRQFYIDVLGLEVAMDMGFIVTLVSPSNPTAQVSLMRDDDSSTILPQISVEVADVDDVHSRAVSRGLNIVYPLTNEPWGVRRFFVTDPNGTVINVLCHLGGAK